LHYFLWLGLGPETWPSQKAVGRVKSENWKGTRYQNRSLKSSMIGLQGSTMWQEKGEGYSALNFTSCQKAKTLMVTSSLTDPFFKFLLLLHT
jgi:hypothetical protein